MSRNAYWGVNKTCNATPVSKISRLYTFAFHVLMTIFKTRAQHSPRQKPTAAPFAALTNDPPPQRL